MSTGYAVAAEVCDEDSLSSLRQKKKVKKPGFIKRWLLNSLKDAIEHDRQERERQEMNNMKVPRGIAISSGPSLDSDKGIRFQVYKANGGFVVETAMYDRQRDRHNNSIHIITDEQDLGREIGKIITLETLKQ